MICYNQGFLQSGVLTIRGLTIRGSYNQGFLHSGVLQSGVLTIRGSYDQGFLQSGVLTIRGSYNQGFSKISTQPHTTLCIQFLDRENNDKNDTLPLGKQICFTILWGCEEILPGVLTIRGSNQFVLHDQFVCRC